MTIEMSRSAKLLRRAAAAALFSTVLASCTSASDPVLQLRAAAQQEVAADAAADKEAGAHSLAAEEAKAAGTDMDAEAAKGESKPAADAAAKIDPATAHTEAPAEQKVAAESGEAEVKTASADTAAPGGSDAVDSSTKQAIEAKKRGFLSAFFTPAQPQSAAAAIALKKATTGDDDDKAAKPLVDESTAKPLVKEDEKAKPLVKLASVEAEPQKVISAGLTSMDALPGVRSGDQLFEISRKSGNGDTSDVDVYENPGSYQVASAAGFGRMGAHGLLRQRADVDVGCLKPGLVNMLHTIERHYGKKILVTSGYRSPTHNAAVHGAKHSQHMYCAAADIKVDGVSKWELARYVRALPGRGGVGTYCHTNAIHVDVGPERDWNWRCRRGS